MERIKQFTARPDLGMLLIRIAVGVAFIIHGWAKVSNLAGTAGFFESIGLAGFLAYIVALIEFVGGIALTVGVFTRISAALIALVMLGAIVTLKGKMGFLGGYELDFVLLFAALGLMFTGAGKYAISLPKKTAPVSM